MQESKESSPAFDLRAFETQNAIDPAIAIRVQELERISQELLALRLHRNATIPSISRLHSEILSRIFVEVVVSARLASHDYARRTPIPQTLSLDSAGCA